MITLLKFIFYFSFFLIFWAMIGYPISLLILNKLFKNKRNKKDYSLKPTVTLLIVAHNEEKVIEEKLKNVISLEYPKDKIEIVVSSDNSTDLTNSIVEKFILEHPKENIRLYKVKERKGKTNAQNEAVATIYSEFIVMTDANSILDRNSIKELMSSFVSNDIAYVTGRLSIINAQENLTSQSESSYWNLDLFMREVESKIQTITAGNGALYACRKSDYIIVKLIESHDSAMPIHYGLKKLRAIANHDAIAYEKAGEVAEDEFKRKVRMNRVLLNNLLPSFKLLNVFEYRWFTYFYLGHRTSRYLLWINHLLLFITSGLLFSHHPFYKAVFIFHLVILFLVTAQHIFKVKNKTLNILYYYFMTILAQWIGVYKKITGQSRPFWEKAESTR